MSAFSPAVTPIVEGTFVDVKTLASLFDRLAQQVIAVGENGEIRYANPSWLAVMRLPSEGLPDLRIQDAVSAGQMQRWDRWLRDPGKVAARAEVRTVWRVGDGDSRPVIGSLSAHHGGLGPVRLLGVFQDLTPLLAAQAALREQKALHQLLSTHAPVGVFQTDDTGHLVQTNARWRRIAGLQHSDSPRGVWWQMVAVEDRARVVAGWESFLRHGHEFVCEFRVNTGASGQRFARTRTVQAVESRERGFTCIGVTEDITEQRRLEAERLEVEARSRQQQRLESIGTLASGVAHEINNPLMGIMSYAELIKDECAGRSPAGDYATEILRETGRITNIVRNLLTFARQDTAERAPVLLAGVIDETLSLMRTILKRDRIHLWVELPPALPVIRCRSQQIQQVLMNLLTNGRDALNEKYPASHSDKVLRLTASAYLVRGRPWARVTVEDHGGGIPAGVVERMYEPFFTTKSRHKGTGLGLAISLGIVHEHGGKLRVETELGQFTRFHVELPADLPTDAGAEPGASSEGMPGGPCGSCGG